MLCIVQRLTARPQYEQHAAVYLIEGWACRKQHHHNGAKAKAHANTHVEGSAVTPCQRIWNDVD